MPRLRKNQISNLNTNFKYGLVLFQLVKPLFMIYYEKVIKDKFTMFLLNNCL